MLTINSEVAKGARKSNGTYNVRLRFTLNRQMKRLSTSLFVTSKDLTKDYKIKSSSPLKIEVEKLIIAYQEKCAQLQIELNDYSLDDVMNYLDNEQKKTQSIDFIQFSREWIKASTIKGSVNYNAALNALIRFWGKEELDVNQITIEFLEGFQLFLNKERKNRVSELLKQGKRIPSNRALSLYLGSIKRLFNEAMKKYNKRDRNLILIPSSPFEYFRIPKQEATRKRAISADLIKKIWNLPYRYSSKGNKLNCRYNLAKDCFIISFCLIGINSADLYYSTKRSGNTIIYNRTKTMARRNDNAKMMVNIPEIIIPLMENYKDHTGQRLFNFYKYYATDKAFNKAINYGLKEIGAIIGIEDLEYYAARHSWATLALNKVGIDKYTVHAALNHIDESMRVTDIYIERDFVNENRANLQVVKYVFGKY